MASDEVPLYEHDEDPRTWLFDTRITNHGSGPIGKITAHILGPDVLRVNRKSLETSLGLAVYDFDEQLSGIEYDPTAVRHEVELLLKSILGQQYDIVITFPIGYPTSPSLICTLTRKDVSS